MPYFVNLECWNLKYPPLKRLKVFFETFVGLLQFRSSRHTSAIRNCKVSQSVLTAEWSGRLDVVIKRSALVWSNEAFTLSILNSRRFVAYQDYRHFEISVYFFSEIGNRDEQRTL